ncbi:signal-regulatory protein beta-2-like [Theristicus caerulescens]
MPWRAAAARLLLGQLGLFPLRLWGVGAQEGQGFQLQQPQDKVSVAAGQTLTLTCTVSGEGPPGPVKWLKGWGSGNKTVYDQKDPSSHKMRVVPQSNSDFSIRIRDFQPEDAGTYYCVRFRKSLDGADEVFQCGKGTEVSLYGTNLLLSAVAAAVVLCFLLLGLFIALCIYRRKRRGEGESQGRAGPAAACRFSPIPLRGCAGTPGTPSSEGLGTETSHLPNQQSSKEDNAIHYADLQPLPVAPRHGSSPGAACSEYASIRVAAK